MFWGLIMEPERRYTQQVKKSFHISMAALDISSSGEEPAQVMCGYEGRNYLLCTLKKPDMLQCALDLEFSAGSQVSFASNGKSHIHLTGYLTDADEDGLNLEDLEEQEDEDVEEEEQVEEKKAKKKKLKKKNDQIEPPSKKAKLLNGALEVDEDDDDESDDSDLDEDEAEVENEESDDEEDLDDEEGEEEEDEDDEGEEEPEVPQKLSKKQQKKLKQEQQQQKTNGEPITAKKEKEHREPTTPKKQKRILAKGVVVEDLVEGSGPPAKAGRFINVYYEGRLEKNNKVFDATSKGPGFKFRLGSGEVIKAWDIGLVGMKVGGKRKIVCPPNTAYGPKGSPPAIPPNSTLVFTVELKKVL